MAADDPRARLYIVDHLAPGRVIHRRIEVSNTTDTARDVALYSAAAAIANGSFLVADGRTANDLSTWTSVDPITVTIPAGGVRIATVTVAVPRDAAPGEPYAVVWAHAGSPTAAAGISQISRVGLRLYLSVGPGNPPAADVTLDSLTAERSADGRPTVVAAVHNTEGRALDLSRNPATLGWTRGLSAGPFPAVLGTTVGVGDTEPVTMVLDSMVPAGPWNAEITLHSGLLERTGQATITFPAVGTAPTVVTATATGAAWWPYAAIVGVLLLCVAAMVGMLRKRNRRSEIMRSR